MCSKQHALQHSLLCTPLVFATCLLTFAYSGPPPSPSPVNEFAYKVNWIRIYNSTLDLVPANTLQEQSADPGIIANESISAVEVYNAENASATLRLSNIRYVTSGKPPNASPTGSTVARLTSGFNTITSECYSFNFNGVPDAPFVIDYKKALAVLYIACTLSNDHIIRNDNAQVTLKGNRSIELILNTAYMPRVVDLKNMTSWGAPGRSPNNTRIIIRTSRLQSAGDRLVTNYTRVQGTLPYTVPLGAFGVILEGCRIQRIRCLVTDASSRNVCRYREVCTTDDQAALQFSRDLIQGVLPPCQPPPR